MKIYYLYPANNGKHKYYIITKSEKKIQFEAVGYSDFTKHKDEERNQRYNERHEKNENWSKSGIDTAGFWSYWLLWNKLTIKASYEDINIYIYICIYRNLIFYNIYIIYSRMDTCRL